MANTVLVTGATGTIGSQVVAALADLPGVSVRAAVRGEKRVSGANNVSSVDFDYDNPDTLKRAVEGANKVFLLTPFAPNQVELAARLLEFAKGAGVQHIVKLSAIGCEHEPGIQLGRWHRAVEKLVEASGMAFTFLRPNNFLENFINYYRAQPDGAIYLPWGSAGCSFIAGADIAAVAKLALTTAGHEGQAYELTGPAALTIGRAAEILSEVSGRKIHYVDVPEEAARAGMLAAGMPGWMTEAMMELHAIDKAGYAAAVSPVAERLLGRAPMSFEVFARENAAAWKE
jgi:uncharacterized protein YbjT (DUF2867 family)